MLIISIYIRSQTPYTIVYLIILVRLNRVQKSSFIIYSKGKDYSSSVPVGYIPKKSSKTEELVTSQPMKGSEDKDMRNVLDLNALKAEFSNGGKSLRRSFVLDENKIGKKKLTKSLIINDKSGLLKQA